MALRRVVASLALALAFVSSSALAQQPKPKAPPGTKTDLEIDPDKPKEPPPPLPPVEPGQWGVGGQDEEGRFAPAAAKKKQQDEEAARKKKEEEEAAKRPANLGPARAVTVDTVVGFGSISDVVHPARKTTTTGASFLFGFDWRIFDIWTLSARMPFTRASTTGPQTPSGAGDTTFNTFALGNLQLGVSPSFKLTPTLRLPVHFALVLPIAQGDPIPDPKAADKNVAIAQALMNQASSWARGWEEMPLFANRRLGLRLGGGVRWDSGAFHATGDTRLDLMIRTGGNDPQPPDPQDPNPTILSVHTVSLAWVTSGSFSYGFLDGKVEPMLRAWLAYATMPITTPAINDGGAQFVLEPRVQGTFPVNADRSMAIKGGLGVILPVSGSLGGGYSPNFASMKGFRIDVGFGF